MKGDFDQSEPVCCAVLCCTLLHEQALVIAPLYLLAGIALLKAQAAPSSAGAA
jgi:hypothetical protein